MAIWLLIAGVASAACDDPGKDVADAEAAVLDTRTADAHAAVAHAQKAFACSAYATPDLVARMWLAEAVAFATDGDDGDATAAFAAAWHAEPDHWNDDYGKALEKRYQAVGLASPGTGGLQIAPPVVHDVVIVDGTAVSGANAQVASGLRVVQVGPPEGPAQFASVVQIGNGQNLVVQSGLSEATAPIAQVATTPTPLPPVAMVAPSRRGPRWWLVGVGGVLAAAGGVTAGDTWAQSRGWLTAGDEASWNRWRPVNNVSLAVCGLGVVVAGAGLVFTVPTATVAIGPGHVSATIPF